MKPRSHHPDSWPHTINAIRSGLLKEALAGRNVLLFEAARSRHLALARHASVASVLGVLADDTGGRTVAQEAVVRALVEEHQSDPGPFWSAVLTLAFLPMLAGVRFRLSEDAVPGDELTSIVVHSFLQVIGRIEVGAGRRMTAFRLRRRTERRAFAAVAAERAQASILRSFASVEEPLGEFDWEWPGSPCVAADDIEITELAVALLFDRVGAAMPRDHLDLVADTMLRGENLWDFVDRVHPGLSPAARVRAYERLKRLRTRALRRLRRLLAGSSVPKTRVGVSCRGRFEGV